MDHPLLTKKPSSLFTMHLSSTSTDELILPGLDQFPSIKASFSVMPATPSSKKRAGRLQSTMLNVKNGNNFTNVIKSVINEKEKEKDKDKKGAQNQPVTSQVNAPPPCLTKYLNMDGKGKGKAPQTSAGIADNEYPMDEEEIRRRDMVAEFDRIQRVKLNNKMVNSLFLRKVDTEEIYAAITYETQENQSDDPNEQAANTGNNTERSVSAATPSSSARVKGAKTFYQNFAERPLLQLENTIEKQFDRNKGQIVYKTNNAKAASNENSTDNSSNTTRTNSAKKKKPLPPPTVASIASQGSLNEPYRYKGITYVENIEGNPSPLSEHEANHYFGYNARKAFFELYQKMSKYKYYLAPRLVELQNPDDLTSVVEQSEMLDADIQSELKSIMTQSTSPLDNYSFYIRSAGKDDSSVASKDKKGKGKGKDAKGGKEKGKGDGGKGKEGKGKGDSASVASTAPPDLVFYDQLMTNEIHQYISTAVDNIQEMPYLYHDESKIDWDLTTMRDDHSAIFSKSMSSLPSATPTLRGKYDQTASQRSVISAATSGPASVLSPTSMRLTNALNNMSTDFFRDLESITSNDHIKKNIDKELLSKVSFGKYETKPHSHHSKHKDRKQKRMEKDRKPSAGKVLLKPLTHPSKLDTYYSEDEEADDHSNASTLPTTKSMFAAKTNPHPDAHLPKKKPTWDQLNEPLPASPRTHYIAACIREGVQPLPNIIIRRDYTTMLDLSHFGMGDRMGKLLAECISQLPCIQSINLNDNNLTDDSLQYLIESIIEIKSLQELNLSRNKIDGYSAEALSNFLSRPDCPIVRLTLQNADVDDFECDNFVQSLVSNEKLLELDLSSNLLGSAESLSTVDDTISTGGAAIAEYIKSKSCHLEVLKLAWNAIRLKSANILMASVAINKTITYLDLNCNGLGAAAGEVLGDSIMENRTLKTLLVNNNGFTSSACISICVGIVENLALHHIEMNENPIGVAGAKMIMQVSTSIGNRIALHAKNCNTITVDEHCWYDPDLPCDAYELKLHQPFDRAIAFLLLHLVASHSTYVFEYIEYEPAAAGGKGGGTGKREPVKLIQSIAKDREQYFDSEQRHVLNGLRLLQSAASNIKLGKKLFEEADADNSGKLDKFELQEVLSRIGFSIDEDRLLDIMAVFDVDGAGTIDLQEFLALLKSQFREATLRIKEMLEYPIMSQHGKPHVKYIPPKTGILYVKVIDGFVQKNNFYTLSSTDQQYAYNMAKGMGDLSLMTDAIKHSKLRFDEALKMYKHLYKEQPNKAELLLKLIPQMMFRNECRQLVSKVTNEKRVEINRVKLAFGVAFKPMIGVYNGYFVLDLSIEIHRLCLVRLIEQSQTVNARRSGASIIEPGRVGDTSQHQNWSSFRNEIYNGKKIIITPQLFTPMPKNGILQFDFSTTERPNGSELPITDKKFLKVLNNICLLPTERFSDGTHKMHTLFKRSHEKTKDGKLFMPVYQFSVEKALEFGRCMDTFHEHIMEREAIVKAGADAENIKVQVHDAVPGGAPSSGNFEENIGKDEDVSLMTDGDNMSIPSASVDDRTGMDDMGFAPSASDDELSINEEDKFPSSDSAKQLSTEQQSSTVPGETEEESQYSQMLLDEEQAEEDGEHFAAAGGNPDVFNEADGAAGSMVDEGDLDAEQQLALRKKRIKEQKQRLRGLLKMKHGISKQAKAIRFVEVIEDTCSRLWMYCRHLTYLCILFQQLFGNVGRSEIYGSYIVDLIVTLFPRIIDLHNFEMIYELLSARDCAALFGRLGILNLFNPMKPEVTIELNMDRYEERMVAKIIVYLSVEEPGINLTYKRFQWKRELDPTPGWDVTEPWMTEVGMYTHGYFGFTYYSGEGKNKFGCIPDIPLRKALTSITLVNENEIIDEGDQLPEEYICTAKTHYQRNMDVWLSYLAIPVEKKIIEKWQ